jgi:hypothetical protein
MDGSPVQTIAGSDRRSDPLFFGKARQRALSRTQRGGLRLTVIDPVLGSMKMPLNPCTASLFAQL